MSNDPVGRRPRSAGLHSTLRLAALAAVALGVVLLAAAAFVLSYDGIHHIALRAGVSPELAKLYPLIFDVMLVVAGAAALALRGAGWWARCYAWGSLLILLAAMAVGNAVYATGTTLPAQPTKVAVAVTPWVLLLMAFGLLLAMLRHFRATRSNAPVAAAGAGASGADASGGAAGADGGPPSAVALAAVSGGKVRELPRVDLDTLLGPRAGEPPAIAILHGIGTGQNDGHQVDPVSYGEDTGYVHPDSYLDEGEYSPHGDTGGPGGPDGPAGETAGDGTRLATHGSAPVEIPATAEAPAAPAAPPTVAAAPAESPATPAAATASAAEQTATPGATPATSAESATDTEPLFAPAETPATSADPVSASAAGPATDTEPLFSPAEAPVTAAETPATTAGRTAAPANPAAAPATAGEPLFTPAESPATAAETPAPAEPPAAPAEPVATAAETPAAAPVATAAPTSAPAAEAASGTGNGVAAGGGPAGAGTPAGQEGAAEAGQDGAGGTQESVGAEVPTLERIRSSPTRPEE